MKSKNIALILTVFGGAFGVHRFYYGEIKKGVLYLLMSWTFIPALLAAIHFVQLVLMSEKEFQDSFSTSVVEKVSQPMNNKAPESLGDVFRGMKDTWNDPESRKKILRKVFFKHF